MMREMGVEPSVVMNKIGANRENDSEIWPDPKQLLMNLVSLCIFPFAARPVITEILFNGDESAYLASMRQRKEILPGMFMQLMKQNQ
jgi:hypothetical protein